MRWRLTALGVLAVLVLIAGTDWLMAQARLGRINLEVSVNPPEVVADGQNSVEIAVRITENGVPRANDLVQAWLGTGAGRVLPDWSYTDENGVVVIQLTPNRYSPYDPKDNVELHVLDTSIGRLVEVGKHEVVRIGILQP